MFRSAEETDRIARLLQNAPIFSGLDSRTLRFVVQKSEQMSYPSNTVIVKQNSVGTTFHLILQGTVEVRRDGKTIAKLGREQFFGEMSLLDQEPRSADVVAVEETRCLVMNAGTWHEYLKSNPGIAIELSRSLAKRLRETDKALSE